MAPKATDRIKALQQQRAAALAPQVIAVQDTPADPESPARQLDTSTKADDVQAHFGGFLTTIVESRQVQRISTAQIAPDIRPDMRQPRLLPPLEELLPGGTPAPMYSDLLAELYALGRSLQEQQIQPIVVYPGTNAEIPAARYLLLVGQRRWTAACLVGLETLDTIVIDPPTAAERIRIQYAENEDREEFSDMERAWSLQQMKLALADAPWERVEERLQLSRARRHQLIRLLAFSPAQQRSIARLRLQETQLRSLHTAVRNDQLAPAQVDTILHRLSEIVAERTTQLSVPDTDTTDTVSPATRRGVDGPTIARLVARTQRTATVPTTPRPRWIGLLEEQIVRTRQALQRANGRIDLLSVDDAETLLALLQELGNDLDHTTLQVNQRLHITDMAE